MPTLAQLENAMNTLYERGEKDKARAIAQDIARFQQTKRRTLQSGSQKVKPYMGRVAEAAGVPAVLNPDLSVIDRSLIGLSETFPEKQAEFAGLFPAGTYKQVKLPTGETETIYQKSPIDPVRIADEPGMTMMDIADRPQELINIPAQAATAAFGPAGVVPQVLSQAAISGITHLAKEGIETLRGKQQQSLGEVLTQAGIESAGDLFAGGVAGGIGRVLSGPAKQADPLLLQDYANMQEWRKIEPSIPMPLAHQARPDMAILNRIAAQSEATSSAMQAAKAAQERAFSDVVNRFQTVDMGAVGGMLVSQGQRAMDKARRNLAKKFFISQEEAGKAISGVFTEEFNRKSRQQINKAYSDAGRLAEGVSFDLSRAQNVSRDVLGPVEATATEVVDSELVDLLGKPLTQQSIAKYVDVSGQPAATVARVGKLLGEIDSVQGNWEVVKELRSQVGDAIKELPKKDKQSGQAEAIYGALTQAIENPIGGAGKFTAAWKKANQLARSRFEVFEQGRVLNILKNDSPADIANRIGDDATMLTPVIRGVIDKYAPARKEVVRNSVKTRMLSNLGGSETAVRQYERDNLDAFRFIFPTSRDSADFLKAARAMDDLKKLPINQMLNSAKAMSDRGSVLLRNIDKSELKRMIGQYGGPGSSSVKAMRLAAFVDILDQAAVVNKSGRPFLDTKKLSAAIDDAKKTGVWDQLLTKTDKVRLRGMDSYLRRVFKSMMDTGTSLEQAKAVASMKHPSTFVHGFHSLAVNNKIIAPILMSKTAAKLFAPTPRSLKQRRGTFTFLGNLANEIYKLGAEEVR